MASQLAAQDYLARLQASAAATGMPGFATIPTPEGLLPGYPLLPHAQTHGQFFLLAFNVNKIIYKKSEIKLFN